MMTADPIEVEVHCEVAPEPIEASVLRKAINLVASRHNIPSGNVSIGIVDDKRMREMNAQFLDHDYTTDVLSFVYRDDDDFLEGELVLCADYAARAAKEVGWLLKSELTLYAIHGMLHLARMDDVTAEGRAEMRAAEKDVLIELGVPGAEDHREPAHWSTV